MSNVNENPFKSPSDERGNQASLGRVLVPGARRIGGCVAYLFALLSGLISLLSIVGLSVSMWRGGPVDRDWVGLVGLVGGGCFAAVLMATGLLLRSRTHGIAEWAILVVFVALFVAFVLIDY